MSARPELERAPVGLSIQLLEGLRARPKRISSTFLYDARGSQLFDLICEQPEYYPTRTETAILEAHAESIARTVGPRARLVELGSGASVKTRILLDQLPDLAAYVPVDISRTHLLDAASRIARAYRSLQVQPVCADFTLPFVLPKTRRAVARTVVFFPGSTIGNFDHDDAVELLASMREIAGPGGGAIVGIDLVKDVPTLIRAYDDAAGVTAAFNLNLLARLNREFGADFDLSGFAHDAVWNARERRIEMHLVSVREQVVQVAGERFGLAAGERIIT
ncbi:MAG TPA: L-histidine N(alpha)-methyltransferase, partial [Steroidobacteraceae bacterium]